MSAQKAKFEVTYYLLPASERLSRSDWMHESDDYDDFDDALERVGELVRSSSSFDVGMSLRNKQGSYIESADKLNAENYVHETEKVWAASVIKDVD